MAYQGTDQRKPVIYTFGDSIVAGHAYRKAACVEFAAGADATVVNMARNGGTIMPSDLLRPDLGGQIVRQCDEVPSDAPDPDIVLFDGGTNDAYESVLPNIGTVRPHMDAPLDLDTFAGCFEDTIKTFRERWPEARIVYLAVAKIRIRAWTVQLALRAIELDACAKWGVTVADVFGATDLDTRRDADRVAYSFDALGSDGLPGTPQTIVYPHPESQPTGTHPNIPAIKRFYVPVLRAALFS